MTAGAWIYVRHVVSNILQACKPLSILSFMSLVALNIVHTVVDASNYEGCCADKANRVNFGSGPSKLRGVAQPATCKT